MIGVYRKLKENCQNVKSLHREATVLSNTPAIPCFMHALKRLIELGIYSRKINRKIQEI